MDLDGTLLDTDLLYESLLVLLARNPLYLFLLPFWLLQGKAALKRQIAARVTIDPRRLPYNPKVLELLRDTAQRPRCCVPPRTSCWSRRSPHTWACSSR